MRNTLTALILTGGLVLPPFAVFASPTTPQSQSAAKSDHVTTGTIKSVDATTMVIARSGKKRAEMTFDLAPGIRREGTVAVGAHVSIRYREDGSKHVATAITVRQPG